MPRYPGRNPEKNAARREVVEGRKQGENVYPLVPAAKSPDGAIHVLHLLATWWHVKTPRRATAPPVGRLLNDEPNNQ